MALPERKYYTLDKAAQILNIGVDDLIHYAAIGILQVCIKFPPMGFYSIDDNEDVTSIFIEPNNSLLYMQKIKEKSEKEKELVKKEKGFIPNRQDYISDSLYNYRSDYFFISESVDLLRNSVSVFRIDGLIAIPTSHIEYAEIDLINQSTNEIGIDSFQVPRCAEFDSTEGYSPSMYYLSDVFLFNVNELLITDYEINLLCNGGGVINAIGGEKTKINNVLNRSIEKQKEERTTTKQSTFIKFLLLMNGFTDEDFADSRDTLLDRVSRKAVKEKLEMPEITSKTLKDWISKGGNIVRKE
ncbi:hypothetical protein VP018_003284 [Morganella morganii]|nr:hypothetical protein [Morganella morganii]